MKRLIITLLVICSSLSVIFIAKAQYAPVYWDAKVLDRVEEIVSTYVKNWNKERLISMLATIKNNWRELSEDPQAVFMIYEIEKILEKWISTIWASATQQVWVRDFLAKNNPDMIVETEAVVGQEEEQSVVEEPLIEEPNPTPTVPETVLVNTPPDQFALRSKQEFYDTYAPFLLDTSPMTARCFDYYDEIDAIAKEYDFPTWLILATWHREHSCYFKNPDNGRWNFQIITNEYPPGEITRSDFRGQIIDFIKFSRWKRWWYDNIQVFGPEPVELSYDSFNLASIRKQAILYNGVYPDVRLDNSRYANENFTQARWWRDGVVAAFIKVLWRELENR